MLRTNNASWWPSPQEVRKIREADVQECIKRIIERLK